MENQNWSARLKKNTANLALWTIAWTLSMALATFGPRFIWGEFISLTITVILINAALGVGLIIANIRHLNGLDEM